MMAYNIHVNVQKLSIQSTCRQKIILKKQAQYDIIFVTTVDQHGVHNDSDYRSEKKGNIP